MSDMLVAIVSIVQMNEQAPSMYSTEQNISCDTLELIAAYIPKEMSVKRVSLTFKRVMSRKNTKIYKNRNLHKKVPF